MKYRCLIVDDEVAAHEVLKNYISRVRYLHLTAQAYDAIEAGMILQEQVIDLIFLDINMPEISGLEFISSLPAMPKVILTTAYSEFALDAYEYGVVDYLVKPIPFNRFLKGVLKVFPEQKELKTNKSVEEGLEFRIDGVYQKINLSEVLYFQSLGNYIKIVMSQKSFMTIITIQDLEQKLSKDQFVRIHRSYIVPMDKLSQHKDFESVTIFNQQIPIGRSYKMMIKQLIER